MWVKVSFDKCALYCMQTYSPIHSFHTLSHHLFRTNLFLPTTCGILGHFQIPQLCNVCFSPSYSGDLQIFTGLHLCVRSYGATSMVTGLSKWRQSVSHNDCLNTNVALQIDALLQSFLSFLYLIFIWVLIIKLMWV